MNLFSYLIRRAGHSWPALVTLSLGVVLATALLASGPVLVNTVIEFGLRRTLLDSDPLAANLRLSAREEPNAAYYQTLDVQVQAFIQQRLGAQLDQIVPVGSTRWTVPWIGEEPLTDQRVNLRFYGTETNNLLEHVEFVAGAWPVEIRLQPDVVAVVIGKAVAQAYGLQVGDRLPLSIRDEADQPDMWIKVAGIVQPLNPQAPYWFGNLSPLRSQSNARYSAQLAALVPPEEFFALAVDFFGPSEVELSWNVLLSPGAIAFDDLPRLHEQLAAIADDLPSLNAGLRVETDLNTTLTKFATHSETVRAPLYFLTATVVLLALYYVTMTSALSLRQAQREFAVLRSRGASGWQLFRLQLIEAGLISGLAVLSGPVLAWLFVSGLATYGPLADVMQAEWTLWLPQAAWMAAVVGAAACMASLLTPVPSALNRSIVAHQQALTRADLPPWWQRLYLDVFVLAVGLILLWRLQIYGSILGGSAARPRVDWLLLLSPLALLLGSATILLRVFPLLLRLGAGLVSQGRGLPAALAFWQAARDPAHIARLVLLLTLAMALGLFSSGLNAALDQSEADRSRYTVGSDLRLVEPVLDARPALESTPGVRAVTSVWRGQGSLVLKVGRVHPFFDLLAIEPHAFAQVTDFRSDFADRPMAELLDNLQQKDHKPQPTLPLPGQPNRLALWLWIPGGFEESRWYDPQPHIEIEARLQTIQGEFFFSHLRMETASISEDGWHYFEGKLPTLATKSFPVSLHSLWIQTPVGFSVPTQQLAVDDLAVIDAETGETTVVEGFEDAQPRWHTYAHGPQAIVEVEQLDPYSGAARLHLDFGPDGMRRRRWYGIQLTDGPTGQPLPALISPVFQATTEVQVGDQIGTWVDSEPTEFQVVGVVNYFPTMYQGEDAGFMITARDPLLEHLNCVRMAPTNSNEILISAEPGATVPGGFSDSARVWEVETVRKAIKADPLALGLRSVTLFGYILTAVLSLAGFGTHFYMSVRQRETVYAVLRALGLSPRQLYGALLLEQVLLIFSGLALGTILGLLLNRLTLPGLPLSLGDRPPVPPFLAQTDWAAVGRIYLTLTVTFLLSLGLATGLLWRTQLHRALRVGEE